MGTPEQWDSVLQYISDSIDFASPQPELPVVETTSVSTSPHPHQPQCTTPSSALSPCSPYPLSPPQSTHCSTPSDTQDVPDDHVPGNTIVSVSTTFHPGANLLPNPPDVILLSSDGVFFYVHSTQMLATSDNHFNGLVPPKPHATKSNLKVRDELGPIIPLPDIASVLNIVLHIVYDLSCAHYHPGTV